MKKEDKYWV